MKKSNADAAVSPARLQEAFEQLRPELAKMRKNSLIPVNVDPIGAASVIRGVLPRLRTMQATIKKELPAFEPTLLEKLDLYSLALIHAHRQCICVKQPPERLKELITRVRKARGQLQLDVECLASRGIIRNYRRTSLRVSTSHRNLASDVLTLAEFFRKNWSSIANRSAVTLEELDQAEGAANELIAALGLRDRRPEVTAQAALDRQKVFTLCCITYDEVRRAIMLVRWEHGDANKFTPSLHGPRRARRSAEKASSKPATNDAQQPTTSNLNVSLELPTSAATTNPFTN